MNGHLVWTGRITEAKTCSEGGSGSREEEQYREEVGDREG